MSQWEVDGEHYRAKRDSAGYIYISSQLGRENKYWIVAGHAGYDFCFRWEDVPALAEKIGIPHPDNMKDGGE